MIGTKRAAGTGRLIYVFANDRAIISLLQMIGARSARGTGKLQLLVLLQMISQSQCFTSDPRQECQGGQGGGDLLYFYN